MPKLYQHLLFLLLLTSCASLSRRSYSVEEVIKKSDWVKVEEDREIASDKNPVKLQWPLKQVSINSKFGTRSGHHHYGLDLKADMGTPIYAAGAGVVVFAGDQISGYGNTVIIKHSKKYWTLYAHAEELVVKPGEKVKVGQCIAYSGDSGNASGPHLHFEVRIGVQAVNPVNLINLTN
jgi:murein DD-endopeptidase MepM/ murein hydrolase activator NlpD